MRGEPYPFISPERLPVAHFYDIAARYLLRRRPAAAIAYFLGAAVDRVHFVQWLDTRSVPWPDSPERTCDTVAWLADVASGGAPWAVVVEFQIDADPLMFGRLLEYLARLWLDLKPAANRGDRFSLGGIVVNLRGKGNSRTRHAFAGTTLHTDLGSIDVNLAELAASKLLADVEAGLAPAALLCLVPLCENGGEAATIGEWGRVRGGIPDAEIRDVEQLTLLFADAAGCREAWAAELKERRMVEPQIVKEWKADAFDKGVSVGKTQGLAEGQAQGRAALLLDFAADRFGPLPADVETAVRACTDESRLRSWLRQMAESASLDDFRRAAGV